MVVRVLCYTVLCSWCILLALALIPAHYASDHATCRCEHVQNLGGFATLPRESIIELIDKCTLTTPEEGQLIAQQVHTQTSRRALLCCAVLA